MSFRLASLLATALALAACGRAEEPRSAQPVAEPPGLAGVYSGELPCSNCPAITATLWLRTDGRFVLRQRYPAADDAPEIMTHALGLWRWDGVAARIVLDGAGPDRLLSVVRDGSLELHTASPVPHLLARESDPAPLTEPLRLEGMATVGDGGATFTECLTGLTLAVEPAGEFTELRRLHRRLSRRGEPALTEVRARFAPALGLGAEAESLVIERVLAVKPNGSC